MNTSRLAPALMTSFGVLLALSASPDCFGQAANVAFIPDVAPPIDGDFNSAANWSDGAAPSADFDGYNVQDGLTARFFSGSTAVFFLTVGNTSYGRLEMTGGSLEVRATDQFEVGESIDADGIGPIGGEFILTGMSTLKAAGAVIGTRSKGLLSVGPDAIVDLSEGGGSRDLRVGSYGPAYVPLGEPEPGLDGDGLVDVQGTLNAATLIVSQSGAKGEFRLSGGTVDLDGGLWMDLCEGCGTNPALLALRSAKVTIIGSSGSFTVGGNDIRATSPKAIFSFTADAGGVTPIVVNSAAEIDSSKLELNLDAFAFTPTSTLTLIDAIPTLLVGEFGGVTFLGNTTADVNYDGLNGDVFLDNFQTAGDFDEDSDVDGVDFLIWQRGFGRVGTGAVGNGDANGDMNVNAADLAIWRQSFGAASAAAVGAAPEPGSSLLALMGCGVLRILRRRRRRQSSQEGLMTRGGFGRQVPASS